MKILDVSAQRFYRMYLKHYDLFQEKYIDWYVDSDNNINMFILVNAFGYHYMTPANQIPELIKTLINKDGEFLGFYEEPEEEKEEMPKPMQIPLSSK